MMNQSHDSPVEVHDLNFTCAAPSNSLPAENRSQVPMEYSWMRNGITLDSSDKHFISGPNSNMLTIKDLQRNDNGTYRCYGQEEGSRLKSPDSDEYTLV